METIQPEILRKARKQHICSECEEPILKGEKYYHEVFKADDIYSWRQHYKGCRIMSHCRPSKYEQLDSWQEGWSPLHAIWDEHKEDITRDADEVQDSWSLWMVKKFSKEQA